jgi:hypothetical protein
LKTHVSYEINIITFETILLNVSRTYRRWANQLINLWKISFMTMTKIQFDENLKIVTRSSYAIMSIKNENLHIIFCHWWKTISFDAMHKTNRWNKMLKKKKDCAYIARNNKSIYVFSNLIMLTMMSSYV